jgi:hypothetical protein
MTIEQLLKSKYAEQFNIEYATFREGLLQIHTPQYIGIDVSKECKITEHDSFIMINTKSISLTLYYNTKTTHSVIF